MNARAWLLGTVALVAACGTWYPVRADGPAGPAGPFVVVVGAGQFQDAAIDPRPTADVDARALFDLLTDPKYLGVPAERARLLLSAADGERNAPAASRENIVKAVEAAAARTTRD